MMRLKPAMISWKDIWNSWIKRPIKLEFMNDKLKVIMGGGDSSRFFFVSKRGDANGAI